MWRVEPLTLLTEAEERGGVESAVETRIYSLCETK